MNKQNKSPKNLLVTVDQIVFMFQYGIDWLQESSKNNSDGTFSSVEQNTEIFTHMLSAIKITVKPIGGHSSLPFFFFIKLCFDRLRNSHTNALVFFGRALFGYHGKFISLIKKKTTKFTKF